MKTIYIDKKLKKYIVPSEMRNTSKADGVFFTAGTRIPIDKDTKFIRLYTAWCGLGGASEDIDVDLSGAFVKDKTIPSGSELEISEIAFYNQTESFAIHSGDATDCIEYIPENGNITAEFIDINIKKVKKEGFKYFMSSNIIYSGADNFNNFQCWSGVQVLDKFRVSEDKKINLNHSTIKLKLSGDSKSHLAFAIDLETMEIVVIDKYIESGGLTIGSLKHKIDLFKKEVFNASEYKMNMKELLILYSKSQNYKITKNKEEADIICDYYDHKLNENQIMFNVSNNLENILGILS